MVETALVNSDIETGKKAIQALDAEHVPLRTALWLYVPDSSEWRLILSLPIVENDGPEAGYRVVQKALVKHEVKLPLRRVSVIGVSEPIAQALRRLVKTPAAGTSDITIGSTVVGKMMIQAAHVYRST